SKTNWAQNSDSWLAQSLNSWAGQNNANKFQNLLDQSAAGGTNEWAWGNTGSGDTAFGFGSFGDGPQGWQGPEPGDGSSTSDFLNWLDNLGKGLDAVGNGNSGANWGTTVLEGQAAQDYARGLQQAAFNSAAKGATLRMQDKIKIQ